MLHGAGVLEGLDHLGNGRALLADGDVDADDALALLVDDRIDGNRGLAGLAVADDQFALAAADGDHGVDGLDARLQRFLHRLARDHARGEALDREELLGVDRTLAVERFTQRIDDATHEGVPHRHLHDSARALGDGAFFDFGIAAEERTADIVLFEVEGHAHRAALELDHLAVHGLFETIDAGNAVTDKDHATNFVDGRERLVVGDLLF